jgi:hypothetical protein
MHELTLFKQTKLQSRLRLADETKKYLPTHFPAIIQNGMRQ